MKKILGMKWQKQIATSVKVGTILRKATPRHKVREVIIETGKVRVGFHRNARALARKVA
jgi:hypothetical protein